MDSSRVYKAVYKGWMYKKKEFFFCRGRALLPEQRVAWELDPNITQLENEYGNAHAH